MSPTMIMIIVIMIVIVVVVVVFVVIVVKDVYGVDEMFLDEGGTGLLEYDDSVEYSTRQTPDQ